MARSVTGVVRLASIPLLAGLFRNRSNHPAQPVAAAPSLSKEGVSLPSFAKKLASLAG